MFKKIFAFMFIAILVIITIINFNDVYKKYNNKEKITAKIYLIDKQSYKYEYIDEDNPKLSRTRTGYRYIVYYSFNYNGEEKTGNFEGNNLFYKQGHNLTIYYDKTNDISVEFILPITLVYIVIVSLIYLTCYILCYTKKVSINVLYEHPNPPLFIQLVIIGISYLAHRVDNVGGYLLSFFFMIISIAIAVQTYIIIVKRNNK